MLVRRGEEVSYESIRQWTPKFGQGYTKELHRRRPSPGDKWHLDNTKLTPKKAHNARLFRLKFWQVKILRFSIIQL